MIYLLTLITAIIAIGLILKYRAVLKEQTRPTTVTTRKDGCFSGCFSNALWAVYLLGGFALIFGHAYVLITYYDYLLSSFFFTTLMVIGVFTVFGSFCAELVKPIFFENTSRIFLSGWVFILFFGVIIIFMFTLPNITEIISGLLAGPTVTSGIIENKSIATSRAGSSYYVDINEGDNHMVNSNWWHSIERGDEIEYAYNPYATRFVDIFQRDQITLTWAGAALISLWLAFFALIISWSWDGFVHFIKQKT